MTHWQAASLKLKGQIILQTLISGLFTDNTYFCLKRSMKSDATMSLKDKFVSKVSCICDGNYTVIYLSPRFTTILRGLSQVQILLLSLCFIGRSPCYVFYERLTTFTWVSTRQSGFLFVLGNCNLFVSNGFFLPSTCFVPSLWILSCGALLSVL